MTRAEGNVIIAGILEFFVGLEELADVEIEKFKNCLRAQSTRNS